MDRGARCRTSAGEAGARRTEGGARGGTGAGYFSGRAACAGEPSTVARAEGGGRRAAMGRAWGLLVGLLGVVWLLRLGHGEERRPETAAQRCFCQVRRAGGPGAAHLGAPATLMRGPHRVSDHPGLGLPSMGVGAWPACHTASLHPALVAPCPQDRRFGVDPAPGHLVRALPGASPALLFPIWTLGETSCSLGFTVVVKRLNDLEVA